jgi:hypothetical protein
MEGSLSNDYLNHSNKRPIGASHGLLTQAFKPVKHHNHPLPTGWSRQLTIQVAAYICRTLTREEKCRGGCYLPSWAKSA